MIYKDKRPLVSVVMPVYNAEKYLWEAIESILDQSFTDFEFIIIDDGSTDRCWGIIQDYAGRDSRIKAYTRENRGIVVTRNELAEYCKTPYMCILDADDIALPDRLTLQYTYMIKHPEVSVLWGHIYIIDENSLKTWSRKYPVWSDSIKKSIFKKSPFAQPAVCIRLSAFHQVWGYHKWYERVEDYKLWCGLYVQDYALVNLDEYLIKYRVFDEQWKSTHIKYTLYHTIRIQLEYLFTKKGFSISNLMYICAEWCLYLLPENLILWLFKKITYTKNHE